jgi:hypothetical protein
VMRPDELPAATARIPLPAAPPPEERPHAPNFVGGEAAHARSATGGDAARAPRGGSPARPTLGRATAGGEVARARPPPPWPAPSRGEHAACDAGELLPARRHGVRCAALPRPSLQWSGGPPPGNWRAPGAGARTPTRKLAIRNASAMALPRDCK